MKPHTDAGGIAAKVVAIPVNLCHPIFAKIGSFISSNAVFTAFGKFLICSEVHPMKLPKGDFLIPFIKGET